MTRIWLSTAGDYVLWRKTSGTTGVAPYSGADGDGSTTIDEADYGVWQSHFGDGWEQGVWPLRLLGRGVKSEERVGIRLGRGTGRASGTHRYGASWGCVWHSWASQRWHPITPLISSWCFGWRSAKSGGCPSGMGSFAGRGQKSYCRQYRTVSATVIIFLSTATRWTLQWKRSMKCLIHSQPECLTKSAQKRSGVCRDVRRRCFLYGVDCNNRCHQK